MTRATCTRANYACTYGTTVFTGAPMYRVNSEPTFVQSTSVQYARVQKPAKNRFGRTRWTHEGGGCSWTRSWHHQKLPFRTIYDTPQSEGVCTVRISSVACIVTLSAEIDLSPAQSKTPTRYCLPDMPTNGHVYYALCVTRLETIHTIISAERHANIYRSATDISQNLPRPGVHILFACSDQMIYNTYARLCNFFFFFTGGQNVHKIKLLIISNILLHIFIFLSIIVWHFIIIYTFWEFN
jgi:hypothetical protein